jgi:toxin ParE1/3/4
MRIVWTRAARMQLGHQAAWIARDRPRAAMAWLERIERLVGDLPQFPLQGRRLPEFPDQPVREVIDPPYRILYLPSEDQLMVVAIKHSRQRLRERDMKAPA